MTTFRDTFEGPDLDLDVWVPHYLPMWSSRAATAATYEVAGSELRLTIPPGQGLWAPEVHEPLRVSGVQSAVSSGPVGSTRGQHAFRPGLVVREAQPTQRGWTPHLGRIEVRARMELSPRSMAAGWLIGLEDEPEQAAEICIFEVFGDALETEDGRPTAAVGMGVHPFRDPAITDEFDAPRIPIDVTSHHSYAVDWRPGRVDFSVDGEQVRTVHQGPDYPMQLMLAVFDFPEHASAGAWAGHVPVFAVDEVRGRPPE